MLLLETTACRLRWSIRCYVYTARITYAAASLSLRDGMCDPPESSTHNPGGIIMGVHRGNRKGGRNRHATGGYTSASADSFDRA
jgi:hypothetical protein